ncbi:MAG: DUF4012 domain-containing protein, partial [bacterium]|nr:DUF4012 domain-containing protein [bacterium]
MQPPTKKNIDLTLHDIRKPIVATPPATQQTTDQIKRVVPILEKSKISTDILTSLKTSATQTLKKFSLPQFKKQGVIIAIALVFLAGIGLVQITTIKHLAIQSYNKIKDAIPHLVYAVKEFRTDEVASGLRMVNDEIQTLHSKINDSPIMSVATILAHAIPHINQLPYALDDASDLSKAALALGESIDFLKRNSISLITQQRGKELVAVLKNINTELEKIGALNADIKKRSDKFKSIAPELASAITIFENNYIAINLGLYRAQQFIEGLLALAQQPTDQHILLIFHNETEMRPAGGFIGSFGDVVLNQGNLVDIRVDDIYNADRQFEQNIIPPHELRHITPTWGARDANWFFDFPTSAKKVIEFLEQSALHNEQEVAFQGALAINTRVLGSLLAVVGPIALPTYNLVITADNFLQELQYEVEAGRDKKPGQNPKRILSVLTPLLFEKLNTLTESQKEGLITALKNHITEKDIMFYFKDFKFQNTLETLGVAGKVIGLPNQFFGDYLAVVQANVAGGKTDLFTAQIINVKSELLSDNTLTNTVTITRTHTGNKEKEWWYTAPNTNYTKILVPERAVMRSVTGGTKPPATYTDNYPNTALTVDSDLYAIEKNNVFFQELGVWGGKEFGKNSFGTWFTTPAGNKKTLTYSYERKVDALHDGDVFTFIFQKQSGSNTTLSYAITAPPGFIWKESQNATASFNPETLNALEKFTLTLKSGSMTQ